VADEITGCFEADGTLADRASPRLRELRGEWHAARQRMLARMEDMMGRYEGVLQDRFVTEREGRWVLPVRSDAHERFPGIVHATSASGATLFVEPRAVVPMGNRLKVLEAEVKREEEAVYARLTALVADALPSVEAAARALAVADVRAATAKLAHEQAMVFPEIVDQPRIDLKRGRHLLLALDLPHVVPSDLVLEAGRAIVVSGPNAGGKTVALKTMGLAALMVRAGIPVPCDAGSVVGLFDVVLTDVGDDQSLQKNLSTFSAHISNISTILLETTRGALVLLDELAGGTDPREGEALAAGVLDSLCARGGAVAATTHYEGLKALALADTRFVNASVGFDLATMTPTFRLAMGVPGSSSALAVARRFGMPSTVIERAERFLTREDHNFEEVVKRLNDERAALELARAAADEREREARVLQTRLEGELETAKSREKRALGEEARELMDRLRRARDDLRGAQARLRAKKVEPEALREAERAVERVAGEVALGGPLEPLMRNGAEPEREVLRAPALRRGARVWVQRLRAEAEVLEVLPGEQVRVAAGALKLTVPSSELRAALPIEAAARAVQRRVDDLAHAARSRRRTRARRARPWGPRRGRARFFSGTMTRLMPARCAARTFSLRPPMGSTRPRSVISPGHRHVVPDADPGEERDERREHRDARARAVLRHRAGGDVDVEVALVEEVLRDAPAVGVGAHVAERGLGALLHDVAELTRERELAACRHRVASTNRISPPTGVHARPVATPGSSVRSMTSRRERRRAEVLAEVVLRVERRWVAVPPRRT
jgi:DNA mismatch repair protein MutS2